MSSVPLSAESRRIVGSRYRSGARAPSRRAGHATLVALVVLLAQAVASTTAAAQAAREPLCRLVVRETAAQFRLREPLTFGVPLPAGRVADAERLRCWRADGTPLPVQARALERWPDGSLRWALVDTQITLQSREEARLVVGTADDIEPTPNPWRTRAAPPGSAEATRGVVLTDGTTEWEIFRRDADADRVLGLRALLVDRFGHSFHGALDLATGASPEFGPLRASYEIRGAHRPRPEQEPDALLLDFHVFIARVHLLASTGTARLEWTVRNGPLHEPPGALAFRSYELLHDGFADADGMDLPFGRGGPARPFALVQDGPTRGLHRHLVDGAPLDVPREEDLWGGVLAGARSFHLLRTDSFRNHPVSLSWTPDGPLRTGLLAPAEGREFWLDDATQKTFRFVIAKDAGRGGRARMLAAARPVAIALDPRDVAASRAWGDTGTFFVPETPTLNVTVPPPRDPPTGWNHWGEWNTRNTRSTGSPRNRLSVFLEAVQSGRQDLFELALARARHAMDLRPYHIDGFRAADYPRANLYEGIPHVNEPPENRLGRTGMSQRHPDHKRGLPPGGHGYNGFDAEHMTLDDVFECWRLTGDAVAHDALVSAGEAMLTWRVLKPDGGINSARTVGWTLRALVQVWRATGESRYLDAARDFVARVDRERGRGEVRYLRRGRPDPRHLADRESESPWMVAVALHGLSAYWSETHDPLVPPMLVDSSSFILAAWRGNGFVSDLPVDGPLDGSGTVYQPLGTSQWIPGALAEAAFITGDHRPVDRVYPYYRQMKAHTSQPLRFGSRDWHWWQASLVSLSERHGTRAVNNPAAFRMPGE